MFGLNRKAESHLGPGREISVIGSCTVKDQLGTFLPAKSDKVRQISLHKHNNASLLAALKGDGLTHDCRYPE